MTSPMVPLDMWEVTLINYTNISTYVCPECGTTAKASVVEACNACVMKFHLWNPAAPSLTDYIKLMGE